MALFKCKACGAPLEVRDGTEIAHCPYCGMKQTLPKDDVHVLSDGTSVESLLKRAYMFLEDGEFTKAAEYCDRVLDIEPENARAYLCKLMGDLRVRHPDEIAMTEAPYLSRNKNYIKAMRFADSKLRAFLQSALEKNNAELVKREELYAAKMKADEQKRKQAEPYENGCKYMEKGLYALALRNLQLVEKGYLDVDKRVEECKEKLYDEACNYMAQKKYVSALSKLADLHGYKDVASKIEECERLSSQSTAHASGCMTLILQALTFTSLFIIAAVYLL